jgi:hypothetical protein
MKLVFDVVTNQTKYGPGEALQVRPQQERGLGDQSPTIPRYIEPMALIAAQ